MFQVISWKPTNVRWIPGFSWLDDRKPDTIGRLQSLALFLDSLRHRVAQAGREVSQPLNSKRGAAGDTIDW